MAALPRSFMAVATLACVVFPPKASAQRTPTLIAPLARVPLPKPAAGALRAAANQNRVASGVLANRVLTLSLEVATTDGGWRIAVPVVVAAKTAGLPKR